MIEPTPSILHVDMDAFYVSVEVKRDPTLRGKPVVVGGADERGVVAAASYEARAFGIRSAMPSTRARRLCPDAIFLSGDHALYGEVSRQVHSILESYTPIIEPIALDEAFLDVSDSRLGSGRQIAVALRDRVRAELSLGCSVGVARSKMLAKLASEAAKPVPSPRGARHGRGVVIVEPDNEIAFLHSHPVQALWGVGPVTLAKLESLDIRSVGDLAKLPQAIVVGALGDAHGNHLHELSRGVDDRPVEPNRDAKSIGHEKTFPTDVHDRAELRRELDRMSESTAARLQAHDVVGRTVTVKVRYGDFRTITRSMTLPEAVDSSASIGRTAATLLAQIDISLGVRLLGVRVTALSDESVRQLSFEDL